MTRRALFVLLSSLTACGGEVADGAVPSNDATAGDGGAGDAANDTGSPFDATNVDAADTNVEDAFVPERWRSYDVKVASMNDAAGRPLAADLTPFRLDVAIAGAPQIRAVASSSSLTRPPIPFVGALGAASADAAHGPLVRPLRDDDGSYLVERFETLKITLAADGEVAGIDATGSFTRTASDTPKQEGAFSAHFSIAPDSHAPAIALDFGFLGRPTLPWDVLRFVEEPVDLPLYPSTTPTGVALDADVTDFWWGENDEPRQWGERSVLTDWNAQTVAVTVPSCVDMAGNQAPSHSEGLVVDKLATNPTGRVDFGTDTFVANLYDAQWGHCELAGECVSATTDGPCSPHGNLLAARLAGNGTVHVIYELVATMHVPGAAPPTHGLLYVQAANAGYAPKVLDVPITWAGHSGDSYRAGWTEATLDAPDPLAPETGVALRIASPPFRGPGDCDPDGASYTLTAYIASITVKP